TGTAQGLNALPLMWLVQALQTSRPHPYLGPWTPRRSRRTHSSRTLPSQSTVTRLPLRMNEWRGIGFSVGLLEAVGRRLRQRRHGRVGLEAQRQVVIDREASWPRPGGPRAGAGG